jgi:hypothetical protein
MSVLCIRVFVSNAKCAGDTRSDPQQAALQRYPQRISVVKDASRNEDQREEHHLRQSRERSRLCPRSTARACDEVEQQQVTRAPLAPLAGQRACCRDQRREPAKHGSSDACSVARARMHAPAGHCVRSCTRRLTGSTNSNASSPATASSSDQRPAGAARSGPRTMRAAAAPSTRRPATLPRGST